jgi:hypothetical protein
MSRLIIDYKFLFKMDENFKIKNIEKCETEIESIVFNLWKNIHHHEKVLKPAFVTFLQTNILRSLYICYFSMLELIQKYDDIHIQNSTIILDIVANYLKIELPKNRKNHDEDFGLLRVYSFQKKDGYIKAFLRSAHCMVNVTKGIDVLYLNSGKLDNDFKHVDKSMSALHVKILSKNNCDDVSDKVIKKSKSNISNINLSIPLEVLFDLLCKRVYCYLPQFFSQIDAYYNFMKLHKIKLIVISAATHEESHALLAAANKLSISSLLIGHGHTGLKNQFLDGYVTYQGTINDYEYKYKGVKQFKLKMEWFENEKYL